MPGLDIRDLVATTKTAEENEKTLNHFRKIAFSTVPADEINIILNQNRDNWEAVWVQPGTEAGSFGCTEKIIRKAKGNFKNIISLIVLGTAGSIIFMHELKEYADDFSFSSAFALPGEKVVFILFFLKK